MPRSAKPTRSIISWFNAGNSGGVANQAANARRPFGVMWNSWRMRWGPAGTRFTRTSPAAASRFGSV